jgi:glucoamylase
MVRLGVKPADDENILNTLKVIDDELMYDTVNGSFWHRASFDGYGERPDGTQWEPVTPGSHQTIGRGWPLLTGEAGRIRAGRGLREAVPVLSASAARAPHCDRATAGVSS